MKKTIITVFGVIITLVLAIMVFNLLTGGGLVQSVAAAVADPINKAWQKISGNNSAELINTNVVNSNNSYETGGMGAGDLLGSN